MKKSVALFTGLLVIIFVILLKLYPQEEIDEAGLTSSLSQKDRRKQGITNPKKLGDTPIGQAQSAYFHSQPSKALQILKANGIMGQEHTFEEGCELALSIYAEKKRIEKLLELAPRCLAAGKAPVLSNEALAMAYVAKGKPEDAVLHLKEQIQKSADSATKNRLGITLAHAYLSAGKKMLAIQTISETLNRISIWEPWATRWLRLREVHQEKLLLEQFRSIAERRNGSDEFKAKLDKAFEAVSIAKKHTPSKKIKL